MPKKYSNKENYQILIDSLNLIEPFAYDESVCYLHLKNKCNTKRVSFLKDALIYQKPKNTKQLLNVINIVSKFKRGYTLEKLLYCYEENVANKKWKLYCDKQSLTNSFEYKNEKYGMTKSDFLQYNKSRSTTYENMIKRYGNELGDLKWRKYCERQAHTNSKEYLGDHEYSRINELKSHTYETYLKRYGNSEIAKEKIYEYHNKIIAPYSKKSQILFEMIKNDELFKNKKCYYATLNAEYGILDISTNRYFKYDFVCLDYMFGIEFQGDHYHGNPSVYSPTDFLKGRGQKHKIAKDVWEKDQYKCDLAKKERNIDVIQIWECDWDRDPKKILNRILEYVKDRV